MVTERYSYSLYKNGEEMLFDLKKDPQENQNEAGNPEYSKILERMRDHLKENMAKAENVSI